MMRAEGGDEEQLGTRRTGRLLHTDWGYRAGCERGARSEELVSWRARGRGARSEHEGRGASEREGEEKGTRRTRGACSQMHAPWARRSRAQKLGG
eukprot:3851744-Pyramimonas_sp.AAC.1